MANDAGIEARNVAGAVTEMRIDELISNLAIGIARGQMALDQACMEIAQFMSTAQVAFGKRAGTEEPDLLSLIELGFTPNFYQFVDTILEVRVAVSSKFEERRETDVSDTRFQENEYQQQSQYEQQQQSSYGGWGYSAGGGWSWGWGGGGWGYGASGYGYSGSASSRFAGSSSAKSKNLMLTTVDAKYASTYNFAVEAASIVKTKIVPVPPPAVFEEVVRAKIQERRDWEQRMRWTDQARGILASVAGLIQPILSLTTGDNRIKDGVQGNKDKVAQLQSDLSSLKENYGQLTTNHWSVIQNVSDRQAAGTALTGAVNQATALHDLFETEDLSVDKGKLDGLLSELNGELTNFQTKIAEMLARSHHRLKHLLHNH
jgi:hypothetical protein